MGHPGKELEPGGDAANVQDATRSKAIEEETCWPFPSSVPQSPSHASRWLKLPGSPRPRESGKCSSLQTAQAKKAKA